MPSRQPGSDEQGFTLIELMVVVMIIAILLAIAIPTFMGARERAQRRAAQSNVRNVFTVQMVYYSDSAEFTENSTALAAQDGAFTYVDALPVPDARRTVYVDVQTSSNTNDTVYLASRAPGGECYWLRTVGNEGVPRFAAGDCTAVPTAFTDKW